MNERIFIVDAFTDVAFKGNPAGVVLLEEERDDEWMRGIAAEVNHSETAFVLGDRLRWFTPETEVELCGHATLATAHVLGGTRTFQSNSGALGVSKDDDGWVSLDFPKEVKPFEQGSADDVEGLLGNIDVVNVLTHPEKMIVEVTPESMLGAVPNIEEMMRRGRGRILLTARGVEVDVDYTCRYFAPIVGIPEDPVTGRAYCLLGPYWGERLGKTSLVARQLSRRGGVVRHEIHGERVTLRGQATTISAGQLLVP